MDGDLVNPINIFILKDGRAQHITAKDYASPRSTPPQEPKLVRTQKEILANKLLPLTLRKCNWF